MKEMYSNADDCYELTKLLYNKLSNKIRIITSPYIEVVEGEYNCFDYVNYKTHKDYINDKVSFNFKCLKNEFIRVSVGDEYDKHSLGHKLAVLSDIYKVIKDEFGEPTLFYTIKEDNERTLNLQWSFNNKEEDIKEFMNNNYFIDANIEKVIIIDNNNSNNKIGLPIELREIIKEDLNDYIEYKKGCLELDKKHEELNHKKRVLKM